MLKRSQKGHFILDLVDFLTDQPGDPNCLSSSTITQRSHVHVNQHVDVLELHPLTFDMNELHHVVSNQQTPENSTHARRQFFKMCVDRHREPAGLSDAQAGDSMCTLTSPAVTHVNNLSDKFNGIQQDEQVQGGREVGPSRGFVSDAGGGSPRSTIQKCLAMFQESQRLRQRIQQVWQLGALQCARSSSELCSTHVSSSHPSANDGPNGDAMDMLQTDLKGKQPHYELFKKTIEKAEVDNMQYNYMLHGTYSKTSTTSRPPSTASAPAPKAFMPPHQAEDVPIWHHVGTPPAPSDVEIQETDPGVVQRALDIDAGDVSRGTASLGPEDEQYDKSQCRADRRQLNENLVTNKVAKAAARMVQLMVLQLSLNFQNLIIEPGQVSIWEVCCSPTSSLTSARAKEQLNCQRINLANGFDLGKASTYEAICTLYWRQRPRRIWISMQCAVWCPWNALNYDSVERKAELENSSSARALGSSSFGGLADS